MKLIEKRYIIKSVESAKENKVNISVVTACAEEHEKLVKDIQRRKDILACSVEYVSEIDLSLIGQFENIKKEKDDETL